MELARLEQREQGGPRTTVRSTWEGADKAGEGHMNHKLGAAQSCACLRFQCERNDAPVMMSEVEPLCSLLVTCIPL